jgi:hypothetical protein
LFACQIGQNPGLTGPHFAWRGAHLGFEINPPTNNRLRVQPQLRGVFWRLRSILTGLMGRKQSPDA